MSIAGRRGDRVGPSNNGGSNNGYSSMSIAGRKGDRVGPSNIGGWLQQHEYSMEKGV